MEKLDKKIAIVTGAASGIGEAIAREFAAEGATVIIADIQIEPGQKIVNEIVAAGGQADFFETDLRDLKQIQALIDTTVKTHGRLDILVANAGLQYEKIMTETTEEQYDHMMSVNMKGTFFCCKYAVEAMIKTGSGNVITTGSVLSFMAEPQFACYCATKAGVQNLARSIATEYGRQNIRANCICPGFINTPLGDRFFEQQPDPEAARQEASEFQAMGRMGETEEVARSAVFLASDDASFITGSTLVIDGGLTAKIY